MKDLFFNDLKEAFKIAESKAKSLNKVIFILKYYPNRCTKYKVTNNRHVNQKVICRFGEKIFKNRRHNTVSNDYAYTRALEDRRMFELDARCSGGHE